MKNIFRKILTWKTVEVILIIILLVVIPQIQSHYMNQYIAENQFKALNNTKEQVAIARTINSMKNWQMVFVYNFVWNIADAFMATALSFYMMKDLIKNLKGKYKVIAALFIFVLYMIINILPLHDIYMAGIQAAYTFGDMLKILSQF